MTREGGRPMPGMTGPVTPSCAGPSPPADGLYQIVSPYFVAGLETSLAGHVYRCAPIIGYMAGWHIEKVRDYCSKRRWTIAPC